MFPIFGRNLDQVMYLSKMTASILDDLKYIVDPSEVSTEAVYTEDRRYVRIRSTVLSRITAMPRGNTEPCRSIRSSGLT